MLELRNVSFLVDAEGKGKAELFFDGLHPNETGRRMIAEKLSSYLQENP